METIRIYLHVGKKRITSYTSMLSSDATIRYPAIRVEMEIRRTIREGKGQVCTCIKGKRAHAERRIPYSSQPLLVRSTGIATCSWPIDIRTIDRDLKMKSYFLHILERSELMKRK